MAYAALACRCLIGIVFIASAISKVRSKAEYRAFARWLADMPLPRQVRGPAAAGGVAVAEMAIVILLIFRVTAVAGQLLAALVLVAFAFATWVSVRRGAAVPCRCFGASQTVMGRWHVARDIALSLIALAGALGSAATATAWEGVALSLAIAVTAAVPVVLFDDLLSVSQLPAPAAGDASTTPNY